MTPQKKQLRAALYARYSTDKQREASIEDQFEQCEKIAIREGAKVVKKFHDKGISGGTNQRPGYQALLASAKDGHFDLIICEDISRLWRNRADYGNASTDLEDLKVHLLTAVGNDTRRTGWDATISLYMSMAEQARKEASYRTRRGLEGKARKGEDAGGRAYGYIPAALSPTKRREIDKAQAAVVRDIFKWRADGLSAVAIARRLNEAGVKPPGASWKRKDNGVNRKNNAMKWRESAIGGDPTRGTGILNNPIYKGVVIWGRTKWTRSAKDSKVRRCELVEDKAEHIEHKVPRLQIVPTELWDRVHVIQTARSTRRNNVRAAVRKRGAGRGRGPGHYLSSILVCKECNGNYIANGERDYLCAGVRSGACSNKVRFWRADVHFKVNEILKNAYPLDDENALAYAQEQFRSRIEAFNRKRNQQAEPVTVDVAAYDKQIAELKRLSGTGVFSPAVAQAGIESAERERAEALAVASKSTDKAVQAALEMTDALPARMREFKGKVDNALKVFTNPKGVHEAREATRALLQDGRIVLAPTADCTAVTGTVRLVGLAGHLLRAGGHVSKVVAGAGLHIAYAPTAHPLRVPAAGHRGQTKGAR